MSSKQGCLASFVPYPSQFPALPYSHLWSLLLKYFVVKCVVHNFTHFSSYLSISSTKVYAVTSNAGEITLLIGVTVLVFLVQEDFSLAGSFADFLRSSNVAFLSPDVTIVEFKQPRKEISTIAWCSHMNYVVTYTNMPLRIFLRFVHALK